MSWLSDTAKKVEREVSHAATNLGVGSDLKRAANIFGAANVGAAVGVVSGFLTGGVPGALYGGATGAVVSGYGKYKGDSSSKYLSNSAGDALIAGTVGPLIYKPAGTALITSPGPVSSYGSQTLVRTPSGGLVGNLASVGSGFSNVVKDAVNYIGKGGITQIAVDAVKKIFTKGDPNTAPNPDYQQGNAVPPGGSFSQWLSGVLPTKSYDPTAPGASTAGGGGSNPTTNVEAPPVSIGFAPQIGGGSAGGSSDFAKPALIIAAGLAGIFFLSKGKLFRHG